MTVWSALYTLIISPLQLLFEVVYIITDRIIGNAGLSIIILSLAVNCLVLPLYKRADELQAEERDIQAKMAPRIKQIKSAFKGDERFFMLQEYYRLNHYKPIYALKSSISLLLQIPFFIAAYNLLSGMEALQGMKFGFINNLGQEDAMFYIGSFPVNILPILMTLINIISGIIYTKGHPLKAKIQVYGLAAVFLVLLYHSPSGLVFYWLLNNVFSLVKNIFYKLKDPKKALQIVLAVAGAATVVYTFIGSGFGLKRKLILSFCCLLLCIPLISRFFKDKIKIPGKTGIKTKESSAVFVFGCILMALVTGLLIPSTIVDASALEFIDVALPGNPVLYVINSMLLAFGSWVLWGGVFYFFMSDNVKSLFSKAIWIICGVSIVNYMLFGTNLGNISSTLQFDIKPEFSSTECLLNILAITVTAIVFLILYLKANKITKMILAVACLSVFAIGIYHIAGICRNYSGYMKVSGSSQNVAETDGNEQIIQLSKNGKNVVVLMLDRAMGTQAPYIFNEKPELIDKFDGFTYYPNTLSYGSSTVFGAPALFGGYEYIPERMNERDNESLESKHDEALKVMPVIFDKNGYDVTICDPAYAGYSWIPDLTIYDEYPEFRCYNLIGKYNLFYETSDQYSVVLTQRVQKARNRNFFCFSLMKIAPVFIQDTLYDDGLYNAADSSENGYFVQCLDGLSRSTGYDMDFIDAYSVLNVLPDITAVNDSSNNTFLMMCNDTTHAPCLLQEPDYMPSENVDNTAYDVDMDARYTIDGKTMQMTDEYSVIHYHVNIASYSALGEWFDYLRENGVYDNTRIIIVSDHGKNLGQFDVTCNDFDMEYFMPLLLVKDFDAKGFTVCEDFMTNADTPVIATSGIIDNPVNPFTGSPIVSIDKNEPQLAFYSPLFGTDDNTGNTFQPGSWYSYSGEDIHDPDNWTYEGDH